MKKLWILVFVFAFQTLAYGQVKFPKQKLTVGGKTITAEIAESNDQLQRGLMFRTKMGTDEGMLFIFPDQETRSFWMKNTFLPLSIGFFDEGKNLVDIQDMAPVKSEMESTPPSYVSAKPAKYALEMNQGWFAKNKIAVGAKFEMNSHSKKSAK